MIWTMDDQSLFIASPILNTTRPTKASLFFEIGAKRNVFEVEGRKKKEVVGTPGRIRTSDTRFRRPVLYPAELLARLVRIS